MSYTPPPPPPPGAGGYAAPKTNGKAIWALVTGILSILCCGPLGIASIILSKNAEKEIAAAGGAQTGAGMAKAGLILGIIGLVWLVISAILFATGALSFPEFGTA